MIDPRFYEVASPLTASEIAEVSGARLVRGDPGRRANAVAAAGDAGKDDLTFVEAKGEGGLRAGIVIAAPGIAERFGPQAAVLESPYPRAAFAKAAARLLRPREFAPGDPMIHPSARIAPGVVLEPGCVIGADAAIGADVRIGANAVISPGVQIGAGSRIGARASIRCALIGDGVVLFPGVVIGESGFGLAHGAGPANLSPHFGRVIIQNGVSIGANSCVDRGLFDDTVIGEFSHIDNLSHVGHNVRIGRNFAGAAFLGVSGSSEIGDNVQAGGRVGLRDHIRVGSGANLGAGAGVLTNVPAGEVWAGYPAKRLRTWSRELAWLARAAQKRPGKDD